MIRKDHYVTYALLVRLNRTEWRRIVRHLLRGIVRGSINHTWNSTERPRRRIASNKESL